MDTNQTGNRYCDGRTKHQYILLIFLLFPILILISLLYWYQPEGGQWRLLWAPSLDINLSFRLDSLSFSFACLISGIGVLVQLYALAYLRGKSSRFSFHLYLTLFMLAMLGVVMSDNILLLFVFWELTTITSYLLIGFDHENPKSRKNALQSLIVAGAGGLALLAGLILLGMITDSYELNVIIEQSSLIARHNLFVPSLVLILLGAFTKSAQFPFHFWLPNAMAAPTPVSAYLHSATMVKAGIYLLARLSPVYSQSEIWFYTLGIVGGFTAIWCAILALRQTDLKLMLAYSTNVALGKLTLLLGIGTELAITAMLLFILAHSFYKAGLFMVAGNIDKATGTRDIRVLRGLKSVLLLSLIAAVVAALSKSGVPPLLGFLSKEYMYKAAVEISSWATATFLVVNALMAALALTLVIKPFLAHYTGEPTPAKPVESDLGLWLPPIVLALGSIMAPVIGLGWLNTHVVSPGVLFAYPNTNPEVVKLWQGFNVPLLLSAVTLVLGYILYKVVPHILAWRERIPITLPNANDVFDRMMGAMMMFAKWQTQLLQQKRLSVYVLMFFVVLAGILLSQPLSIPQYVLTGLLTVEFYEVAIALLLVAAVLLCTFSRSRLLAIA
ncbi:proton-conducting transporter membrane subunit, partial [Photobacterium sp. OFAV2-7]|uniref:proton-conducting transporter transmembrane domain-containing protein n=1 Tax=Photobacterium sp. OFAV2-7 TaxID=2917748 RepID=UPI001EF56B83